MPHVVRRIVRWIPVALAACVCAAGAHAQSSVHETEYLERLKASQSVQPLGDAPFGERINLYTGEVSFRHEDIVLEGIGPVIRVSRSRSPTGHDPNRQAPHSAAAFADWTFDIPRIETLVAAPRAGSSTPGHNWRMGPAISATTMQRCTRFGLPYAGQAGIPHEEWWHGYDLVLEDGARHSLLKRAPAYAVRPGVPAPGASDLFPIVTTANVQVTCLPATKNGEPGEAFLAVAPDGTKYWFDWLVGSDYGEVTEFDPALKRPIVQDRMQVSMFVTRIEDRFGNAVTYAYDGARLTSITGTDGRAVAFAWSGGRIVEATSHPASPQARRWQYLYADGTLSAVVLPDASRWTFALRATGGSVPLHMPVGPCSFRHDPNTSAQPTTTSTLTTPGGLTGTFVVQPRWHARSHVAGQCAKPLADRAPYELVQPMFATRSLTTRRLSGIGVDATWQYRMGAATGSTIRDACVAAGTCVDTKWIDVIDPVGARTRHVSSTRWGPLEGKPVRTEIFGADGTLLRTETTTWTSPGEAAFVALVGDSLLGGLSNPDKIEHLVPMRERRIEQQDVQFTWRVPPTCGGRPCFDAFARALVVERSSGTATRTETVAYHDNTARWVLGQVRSQSTFDPAKNAWIEAARTDHDAATALPVRLFAHGQLQQTLTYHANGMVATVSDGRDAPTFDTTVAFSDWYRGVPRRIAFPDGTSRTVGVNVDGTIAWVTGETGSKTCYAYDAMGRWARTTQPSVTTTGACDTSAWTSTVSTFAPTSSAAYGLPAGHWRRTVTTGTGVRRTFYDAAWRPVLEEQYDSADHAGTARQIVKRYDAAGRLAFESYPLRGLVTIAAATAGTRTIRDALGRTVRNESDSELGVLATRTAYLPGFRTSVTNPRGNTTVTSYLAYDEPSVDWPIAVARPEGTRTEIRRDIFGKPIELARAGPGSGSNEVRSGRYYAYDAQQRLCKRTEPETGTTVMAYDAAGNVIRTTPGLPWTSPGDCGVPPAQAVGRTVHRTYDALGRLATVTFPDGRGDATHRYTADGLPSELVVDNGDGKVVTTTYAYDSRRQLTRERLRWGPVDWPIDYRHDANGFLAQQAWHGVTVDYAPNGLGQPTKAGAFAHGVRYHPNGAMREFIYGNGVVHTLAQNARGLPDRWRDADGAHEFLDDGYDFDGNGNVAAISDGVGNGPTTRTMTYDGLDRLVATASPMYGPGASYAYDGLDNLVRVRIGGGTANARDHAYCYDATWRLTNVKLASCAGTSVVGMGYDAQGNLANRNGVPHAFDHGNRLRTVGGATLSQYAYDVHGRRVWDHTTGPTYSQYTHDGRLALTGDFRRNVVTEYVQLNGRLIATRERDVPTNAYTVKYHHTDALGTPIAVTDARRTRIEHNRHEPYGATLGDAHDDGPHYTGHVADASTGLVYMQQRYYDPRLGRFLSSDPVEADADTGDNFNRYTYANANPFTQVDPDGRFPILAPLMAGVSRCAANPACREAAIAMGRRVARWGGAAVAATFGAMEGLRQANESAAGAASGGERSSDPVAGAVDLVDDLAGKELIGQIEAGGGTVVNGGDDRKVDPEAGTHDSVVKSRLNADGTRTDVHAKRNRATGAVDEAKIDHGRANSRGQ